MRSSKPNKKKMRQQYIEKQRFLLNNIQLRQNLIQHVLNDPACRSLLIQNPVYQSMQQNSVPPQKRQTQKSSTVTSLSSTSEHNTHVNTSTEINSMDYVQKKKQQSSSSQLKRENSTSESVAYLRETIHNPKKTIVQHQIKGNTAKMLVRLASGEQRLITFDIPNEDCTVHDLLDQVNITVSSDMKVCLVDDPTLGINYIVNVGTGSLLASFDGSDHGDSGNSTQEIVSSTTNSESLSQNTNASDENSNSSYSLPPTPEIAD